jgi:hypothetical protein
VDQVLIDFKKACDSVWRKVLYDILIKFDIPIKLVILQKCVKMAHSRVQLGKHLSDMFPIMNGLKQGDTLLKKLQLCFRMCHEHGLSTPGESEIRWYTSAPGLC